MNSNQTVSAIVTVTEGFDDIAEVYEAYKKALDQCSVDYEIIYVLDGEFPEVASALDCLKNSGEPIKVISFAKWFGESVALTAGFDNSNGDLILTLPAYLQTDPKQIPKLFDAIKDVDLVSARRFPRIDGNLNKLQSSIFHGLLRLLLGSPFRDLGCGVRLFRRDVVKEVQIYADQHRFLPLIALQQGFRTAEVDLAQAVKNKATRLYPVGVYIRRLLDVLSIYFLLKFTHKPLRFFGLIGTAVGGIGAALLGLVIVQRLFFAVDLGDRPLLLLASLMVVLGTQIIAVGLIGEIIIFANGEQIKGYRIDKIK